jgi:hypothetical protein
VVTGGIDHRKPLFFGLVRTLHVANLARGDILTATDSVVH